MMQYGMSLGPWEPTFYKGLVIVIPTVGHGSSCLLLEPWNLSKMHTHPMWCFVFK